jgi:hypothetical protein
VLRIHFGGRPSFLLEVCFAKNISLWGIIIVRDNILKVLGKEREPLGRFRSTGWRSEIGTNV